MWCEIGELHQLASATKQPHCLLWMSDEGETSKILSAQINKWDGWSFCCHGEGQTKMQWILYHPIPRSTINSTFWPWLPRLVSPTMNIWLARIPRSKKTKKVIDKFNAKKAPGPGSFSICLFQVCWDILKDDIVVGLTHLFLGRSMLREINHTFITLVPKVVGAKSMSKFMSISYVNSLYKIQAKNHYRRNGRCRSTSIIKKSSLPPRVS